MSIQAPRKDPNDSKDIEEIKQVIFRQIVTLTTAGYAPADIAVALMLYGMEGVEVCYAPHGDLAVETILKTRKKSS